MSHKCNRHLQSCLQNMRDKSGNVVYLDFQKALNKVSYKSLLSNLKSQGSITWLEGWLAERKQRVVIDGNIGPFKWSTADYCVWPCSFYITYVNYIDDAITCKLSRFVGGLKISKSYQNCRKKVQLLSDLDLLLNWSNKWQITCNLSKCVNFCT